MSLYDDVLGAPDTASRKIVLDALCREKIVEGLKRAITISEAEETGNWLYIIGDIRLAIAEQKERDAVIAETLLVYGCKEIAKAIRK